MKQGLRYQFILMFLALNGLFANAEPEIKGTPSELQLFLHPQGSIVTLKGEGKATAFSDKAIINLIITTKAKKLADALNLNTTLKNKVIQTFIDVGIKPTDINTSKFSTSPQFGWFGKQPKSYEIVNRLAVGIYTSDQMQAVATVTDQHPEIQLSGTEYEHTKKTEFEEKVKQKALDDVMKQKEYYEKVLHIKLIPVRFGDTQLDLFATDPSQDFSKRIIVTGSRISGKSSRRRNDEATYRKPPPQTFDEVIYRARIFVEFSVSPIKN
ncbi:MAG TPA: DUF541 domain-containing protein [Aeromonadales bacterium]|nr:DUF541 domain-containing protein [Aeromonadales bacterium]